MGANHLMLIWRGSFQLRLVTITVVFRGNQALPRKCKNLCQIFNVHLKVIIQKPL